MAVFHIFPPFSPQRKLGWATPGTCVVTPLDDDYLQQGCVIGGASSCLGIQLEIQQGTWLTIGLWGMYN
jgi:hypothetical protein